MQFFFAFSTRHSWAYAWRADLISPERDLYFRHLPERSMPNLCAISPAIEDGELFCGEVCAMLGASVVNEAKVSARVPLEPDAPVVPRCACGHTGCGDSQVSGQIN